MQPQVLHPVLKEKKRLAATAKATKQISRFPMHLMALLVCSTCLFTAQVKAQVGTWVPVTRQAPDANNGVMLVMSDGSIFCHSTAGGPGTTSGGSGNGSIFDRLVPDSTGNYANGTWSQAAPMISERFSFSSAVLRSGNLYCAGGEYGTDGTQAGWHGETYNPLTNTWTAINGATQAHTISDGNCILLDNSDVLQALVDVSFPVHTELFNPATNSYTTGPSTLHGQNESMWMKLPDNSVLFVDEDAQTSERYIPATNTWIADGNVPVALYDPYGYECGPGLMLPNGKAFFIGGTGHTAFYTPSGTTSPGTWTAGPDVPGGYGMPDAPAAMMVNGKILFACSPAPTQQTEFASPTKFYEFDYTNNTYTATAAPSSASTSAICQNYCLTDLPDGTVLCGLAQDNSSAQYYVYKPAGGPIAAGKPVISSVVPITCTTYMVTGKGFNGISAGSVFGDENENDSNYPLVRFTSNGKVYYARSYNWNSTGVQRGTKPDTVYITLPASLPGNSYIYVEANGIASDSIPFSNQVATLSSPTTYSICSGGTFTYTPTSNTPGATFTWTRAAVAGISNAAITTPQTSNPNEVLVNTSGLPVTVVYAYSVSGGGCANIVNVSVTVNPAPIVSFTAGATTCSLPDTVTFTNTTIAGGTYVWTFGDGTTGTATNPAHPYLTGGSFNVKLVSTSACGKDSVTVTNAVVITTPAAPTATSPVNIGCSGSATLFATGTDSLKWYTQSTGGTPVASGSTYVTPVLSSNTTYYVENDAPGTSDYCTPATDAFGSGSNFTGNNFHADIFNVNNACTLVSVVVYANGAGNRTIQLTDANGATVLQSATINIPNGTSTVTLNFSLTPGTYRLGCGDGSTTTNLYRNNAGAAFPYTDPAGYITITGNDIVPANPGYYYFFYNWKLQGPSCKSARTAVNVVTGGGLNLTSVTVTDVACNGGTNGSAALAPSGGTAPYTYSWSNNQTSATLTGVGAGTYTVSVQDASGCSGTASELITQPNALNISVTPTAATCGQNTGAASTTVSGGTTAYRYLWSNAATTSSISNLAPSTYTLTVTDAHSCTATASAVISSSGSLNLTPGSVAATCNGAATGSASVSVSGGSGTITYHWNTGASTASISNVAAGTYTVTVTETGGCSGTSSAIVSQPSALNVSATASNTGCGSPNGSAVANASGGTSSYSYLWSNAATTSSISNLSAATYGVTVTDNHQCTAATSAVVGSSGLLNLNTTPNTGNCSGGSTGGASVTVNGGSSPFTYLWSNGNTTASISGVIAGTYTVSVSDNSGCSGTASVLISTGSPLTLIPSSTDVTCFNANTGSASVTVSSGTSPYIYGWNNGSTTASITSLSAGSYYVTVTDARNCVTIDTLTVNQPSPVTVTINTVQPTCPGLSNGSATANATGGTPSYTFNWSTNTTGPGVNNLAAGNYSVTLVDANSCTSLSTFTISNPVPVTATVVIVNDSCNGSANGQILINPAGGSGPYTYLWSDNSTGSSLGNLSPGSYSVTVEDVHNCSVTVSGSVTQPDTIGVTISITDATGGDSTGSATISITGGSPPYVSIWSNDSTGNTVSNLPPGVYTVTITDQNGCVATANIVVIDTTVGIKAVNNSLVFSLYPNPAATEVTVSAGNVDKETTLIFEDVLGQAIVTKNITASVSTLDLSSFPSGVYFIELKQSGKKAIKKLVISR